MICVKWKNVLLCTLILLLLPAGSQSLADGTGGQDYEKTGDLIMELIGGESACPGYIETGVLYSGEKEVKDFAAYFYKRYYFGDAPVKVYYTTYTSKPDEYHMGVYTEKPQEAARQHREAEEKLEEAAASMTAQRDYDKAMEIYRWVYDRFEYDYSQKSLSVYSAIRTGKAVCNGYTRLFQTLCARRGLACEIVTGENHAWNRVLIDGEWRYVDITWNKNLSEDRWLFLREDEMNKSHKP